MTDTTIVPAPYTIRPISPELRARVDAEALEVVSRLHHASYQAYLVGGCVRDLLLGRQPKDFDVATSAHPSELRMLFRNCRLIGRRFRLAHIFFRGNKIIETATFRANPLEESEELPEDLLVSHDNVFGSAEQDARRRDFTVNGLFLDPEAGQILDYINGLPDVEARIIRTIGDPDVRMREDPVRILRAARFAARLGFTIDPATWQAMVTHAGDLTRCAQARLVEEIYRLVHCGAARDAVRIALEAGAGAVLMPELDAAYQQSPAALAQLLDLLGAYDDARARGFEAGNDFAVALLSLPAYLSRNGDQRAWLAAWLDGLGARLKGPKNDRERAELMLHLFTDLDHRPLTESHGRHVVRRSAFHDTLRLYALWRHGAGLPLDEVGRWKQVARHFGVLQGGHESAAASRNRRGGCRRRGGGGCGGGRRPPAPRAH